MPAIHVLTVLFRHDACIRDRDPSVHVFHRKPSDHYTSSQGCQTRRVDRRVCRQLVRSSTGVLGTENWTASLAHGLLGRILL